MTGHRVLFAIVVLAAGALAQAPYKVVNSFPSPHGTSATEGLAYSNGVLWVAGGNWTIYRVDAYTGSVLGSFQGPMPFVFIKGLTHDGTHLWAALMNDSVYRLQDTTGAVISSFLAQNHADGLAWDGTYLLVGSGSNLIEWYTPAGGGFRQLTVPMGIPRDLASDGVNFWAGYQSPGRIRKHDPTTGAILLDLGSPSGTSQQGLDWGDWHLWSTGGTNATIHQIDVGPPYMELVGTMSFPNSIQFRLTDAQNQVGNLAVVMFSVSGTSGFSVGNVTVPLTFDFATQICLGVLPSFAGNVDLAGVALTPLFPVPPLPAGVRFWAAAVTLSGTNITSVTNPIRFESR